MTERDKKLIFILIMLLIGVLYYYFYQNLNSKLEALKQENIQLTSKEEQLNKAIIIYNSNKEKMQQINQEYNDISLKLPKNLDEKFVLIDSLNLLRKYDARIGDIPIEKKQQFIFEKNNKKIDKIFFYKITLNTQINYENFKKMLKETKDFNTLYMIDNILLKPISGKSTGILDSTFDLYFFGYDDEKAPEREWTDLNNSIGKTNPFK
ncbi:hypothetical protein [Caloramator australicus]|uniref:Uncharacterized protein n=1 Tax=Caloramator australicus RC3 TaxID=857293 RepID=I7J4V6_9CLOT|nr:hypothetical protein [Caloramator australicus]CCJ33101.1 hypothetical protein CAAU_1017 [Caloramator australicus RC3]